MKRKLIIPIAIIIMSAIFFSSCIVINIYKAKQIPVYGNYRLAGGDTATHGKESVAFTDIVLNAIKAEGRKSNTGGFTYMLKRYSGNSFFFICRYYVENVNETYDDYTKSYCFGYIDLVTLKPCLFRFVTVEHINRYDSFDGVSLYAFENLIIYSTDGGSFDVINADTLERVSTDIDVGEYGLCYASDDTLLFKNEADSFYAVNYRSGESEDEKIPELVEKLNAEKYVGYGGKNYIFDLDDEIITFTEYGTDNYFSVTIDELRERNEEFCKVESIFGCELTFCSALVQNGEIYIAASYNDYGMFGMSATSKASTVACFLWETEYSTFEYIGWVPANSDLCSVVKL